MHRCHRATAPVDGGRRMQLPRWHSRPSLPRGSLSACREMPPPNLLSALLHNHPQLHAAALCPGRFLLALMELMEDTRVGSPRQSGGGRAGGEPNKQPDRTARAVLNRWAQKNRKRLEYSFPELAATQPGGFTAAVSVDGERRGTGTGKKKQLAKEAAAAAALDTLGLEQPLQAVPPMVGVMVDFLKQKGTACTVPEFVSGFFETHSAQKMPDGWDTENSTAAVEFFRQCPFFQLTDHSDPGGSATEISLKEADAETAAAAAANAEERKEGVRGYLSGLLWVLEMYHHGHCPDFGFIFRRAWVAAASAADISKSSAGLYIIDCL